MEGPPPRQGMRRGVGFQLNVRDPGIAQGWGWGGLHEVSVPPGPGPREEVGAKGRVSIIRRDRKQTIKEDEMA